MQETKAANANVKLGLAYIEREDYPRAQQKLLLALKLSPDSANANSAMGYLLEKTGNPRKANAYYLRAVTLSSQSGAQKNNYGAFLCRIGQHKKAMQYLLEATQDMQYVNVATAYQNAGICSEMMGDNVNSMQYFAKALQHDPKLKLALYEFVKLALKTHKEQEAINKLEKYAVRVKADAKILALGIKVAKASANTSLLDKYQKQLTALNKGGKHERYRVLG
ncbi:MAG: type IV pilus biogenesis/stability protein PilW [Legionellales bacterium RIFCSPHIGHO2_12_FULL_37_14]|nr:MAG: type IV pilus biogenesis/stability protein PilW [Legionellales bacterium RIFCSPHIGHO2_12_FULL_37_14]